jgi:E3 ubiquitin-protein ligase synoviolin
MFHFLVMILRVGIIMSFVNYAVLSTLILIGTVIHTYIQQEYFFPTLVALSQEKVQLAVVYNFLIMLLIMMMRFVIFLFVGKLNALETEQLIENGRSMVADTLLFLIFYSPTISGREIGTTTLIQYIGMILILKVFHSIASIRTGRMFEVGVPSRGMLARVSSLLFSLVVTDISILIMVSGLLERASTFYTWLLFEFINISILAISTLIKFMLNFADAKLMVNGWPSKAVYVFYTELVADILQMSSYILFMGIFFYQNPARLPVYALADLVQVGRQLANRLRSFKRYREITANMETKFPDASQDEMATAESCIICRDTLTQGCKVLQCGHIFHTHCLRSWVLVQQICPTCRAELLPRSRTSSISSNASAGSVAQEGTPAQQPTVQPIKEEKTVDEPQTICRDVSPASEVTPVKSESSGNMSANDIIRAIDHAQAMVIFYTEQADFWMNEVKSIQAQVMPPSEPDAFRRVIEGLKREVSTPHPKPFKEISRESSESELRPSESSLDEIRKERQRRYEEEIRLRRGNAASSLSE